MNIAMIQPACGPDIDDNKQRVAALIEKAAKGGASLCVLPEMSILEFFPRKPHDYEFFDLAEPIPGSTTEWFRSLAKQHGIAIVYNHYEKSPEHVFYDTSVALSETGEILSTQRMMHLAEEPGYNEKFYYAPGNGGYNVFDVGGWTFGVAICYDRHFPEVFRSFLLQGAEVVLVPTAVASQEPFAEIYEFEMRAAAVTHGVYIAVANRAGHEDPLTFLGNSMLLNPIGNVLEQAGEGGDEVLIGALDKKAITKARILFPFLRDRRPDTY